MHKLDFIFNTYPPYNPRCFCKGNSIVEYRLLSLTSEPYVLNTKKTNYILGKIISMRYDNDLSMWIYRINTPEYCKWLEPKDFKSVK